MERGKELDRKVIELNPISEESEERIEFLRSISKERVLLVTSSDNRKENAVVMRMFSNSGELLKESVLTTTAKRFQIQVNAEKENEINIAYYDLKTEQQAFCQIDKELKTLKEIQVSLAGVDDDHPVSNLFYRQNLIYALVFKEAKNQNDLSESQVTVHKLDFNTGKILSRGDVKVNRFLGYNRVFGTEKGIEIVCLSSPKEDVMENGVYTLIQLDWEKLVSKSVVTKVEAFKTLELLNNEPVRRRGEKLNLMMYVKRNPNTKNYTIISKMVKETSYTTSQSQSGGGSKTVRIYSATFSNGLVFEFDSAFTNHNNMHIVKDASYFEGGTFPYIGILGSYQTDINLYNLKSDTSVQLLTYVTILEQNGYGLNFQTKKNNEYLPEKPLQISVEGKHGTIFYVKSIEEMSPGEFVCIIHSTGIGYRLLIFELE